MTQEIPRNSQNLCSLSLAFIIEWRVVRCLPPSHLFALLRSCLVRTITYEGGSSVAYTVRIRNLANVPLLYLLGLPKFAKSPGLSIFFFGPIEKGNRIPVKYFDFFKQDLRKQKAWELSLLLQA